MLDTEYEESNNSFTFTIFIPTYNRAHTLNRALESIQKQTFRDFEVIIVDDGSTDTTGALVEEFTDKVDFPVVYQYQTNQGQHVAHNAAVELANGYFLVTLDSDDMLCSSALERFYFHWENIPTHQCQEFAGVEGLCAYFETGKIAGDSFPQKVFDSNYLEEFQ